MLKNLSLRKPLVFVDLETTGPRVGVDRVVEFGAVRFEDGLPERELTLALDPGMPIPPSATAIHGVTDDHVAGCPTFADVLDVIDEFLGGADLAGYNLRRGVDRQA